MEEKKREKKKKGFLDYRMVFNLFLVFYFNKAFERYPRFIYIYHIGTFKSSDREI